MSGRRFFRNDYVATKPPFACGVATISRMKGAATGRPFLKFFEKSLPFRMGSHNTEAGPDYIELVEQLV
jgi:hypothetical protein